VKSQALYMTHSGWESIKEPDRSHTSMVVWYKGQQPLRDFIVDVMTRYKPNLLVSS